MPCDIMLNNYVRKLGATVMESLRFPFMSNSDRKTDFERAQTVIFHQSYQTIYISVVSFSTTNYLMCPLSVEMVMDLL